MSYKLDPKTNRVYFAGACQRATELNNTTVFTLPLAYRPTDDRKIPILMKNNGNYIPGVMNINATTGDVSFTCNAGDGVTTAIYIVDGVSFKIY